MKAERRKRKEKNTLFPCWPDRDGEDEWSLLEDLVMRKGRANTLQRNYYPTVALIFPQILLHYTVSGLYRILSHNSRLNPIQEVSQHLNYLRNSCHPNL
ncbi:hypothetical protein TNIN_245611 [Trichonephila inaurata madagascariensis]|uniref:Uncharacterized protein n=1 Tax=Trichonephila inaurata madagascariensis TaxID=2747483 RepID=A0A8X6XBF6_9ARAC|nr:hypothetical protein TNIN_245611 [Trichonephila inaurata madagascariensis]